MDDEKINRISRPTNVYIVDEVYIGKLGYIIGKKAISNNQSKCKKSRIKKRIPYQTK